MRSNCSSCTASSQSPLFSAGVRVEKWGGGKKGEEKRNWEVWNGAVHIAIKQSESHHPHLSASAVYQPTWHPHSLTYSFKLFENSFASERLHCDGCMQVGNLFKQTRELHHTYSLKLRLSLLRCCTFSCHELESTGQPTVTVAQYIYKNVNQKGSAFPRCKNYIIPTCSL